MSNREANDHVRGYQPFQEHVRPVVVLAILLAAGTLAILVLMRFVHDVLRRDALSGSPPLHSLQTEGGTSDLAESEPRLQDQPALDLARLRAREEEVLSTYGWVDRETGIVRIPIESAMRLVLEEGLPARKASGR